MIEKWKYKFAKGWYGIDIPEIWYDRVDKFLEYLLVECPNFEIHQIKVKFGGLRFYVQLNTNATKSLKINQEIQQLENELYDESLIY